MNIKEQVQKEIPLNIASNLNTSAHITNIIVANKVILDSKPFKAEVKNEEAKNISNISIQNNIKITYVNRDKTINSVPKIEPKLIKNQSQLNQNFPKNASNEIKCNCGKCYLSNKENIKKEVVSISKFSTVQPSSDDAELKQL